jgi:hypothetical protein
MEISAAQREVRTVYLGGFAGQMVSGLLWLLSAGLAMWVEPRYGILVLVFGGIGIFPLTQLMLRVMGHRASLSPQNRMNQLAMQVAFTLPLNLPLVGAAALYRPDWFYPAFMIALGTHYLPFVFLYGMWHFAALAAILIGTGLVFAISLPVAFSTGGWFTGVVLVLFAFIGRSVARQERVGPQQQGMVPSTGS